MKIDLNDHKFTLEDVRKIIASKDDSKDRQLRVTKEGIAYISDITGAEDKDNLSFRAETWDEGNGYTGVRAASDDDWVARVYKCLKDNWPQPIARVVDL